MGSCDGNSFIRETRLGKKMANLEGTIAAVGSEDQMCRGPETGFVGVSGNGGSGNDKGEARLTRRRKIADVDHSHRSRMRFSLSPTFHLNF